MHASTKRFDQMFDRMDRMQEETNRRFEAVDARFDQMFDRMDRMQETILGFDRRVSRNEGQIEVIREQLQAEGSP
jgi:predicted  nucleic acid-binding Zn-ribbon protein